MTGRERDSWFSGRVSLCSADMGEFADDMEKFRGNLGRRKVNRT